MRKWEIFSIVIVLIMLFAFSFCGKDKNTNEGEADGDTAGETVVIEAKVLKNISLVSNFKYSYIQEEEVEESEGIGSLSELGEVFEEVVDEAIETGQQVAEDVEEAVDELIYGSEDEEELPDLEPAYPEDMSMSGLAIKGNYCYIADMGFGIAIVDITDKTAPVEVARIDGMEGIRNLLINDDLLIASNYNSGLAFFDISTPDNPTLITEYSPRSYYKPYLGIIGNNLLAGAEVIDISDPANPESQAYNNDMYYGWDIAISGNNAFLTASTEGFLVFDVTNPLEPNQIAEMLTKESGTYTIGVAINGDYAYVTDYNSPQVINIINISDPANPVIEATKELDYYPGYLTIEGNYLFVGTNQALVVFDISNPAAPSKFKQVSIDTFYNAYSYPVVDGDYCYLAADESGLYIFELEWE